MHSRMQVIGRPGAGITLSTTHQRLHPVDFAANVLAQNSALQIGKHDVGLHWQPLHHPAHQQRQQSDPQHNPINRKRDEAPLAHPMHEPGYDPERYKK